MAKIFISYSRRDADAADRLAAAFEEAGYEVWIDRRGIAGGREWTEEIVRAIQDAGYFVLLLSPHSVASEEVKKELILASGERKRILPVMLRGVDIPDSMKYALVNKQWIDLSEDFDTGLERLLQAIDTHESGEQNGDRAEQRGILLRDEIGATPGGRMSGALMGALCWGGGGCLGMLLILDIGGRGVGDSLALVSWIGALSTVFGAAFGGIFSKKTPDVTTIVVAPVLGVIVLSLISFAFFRLVSGSWTSFASGPSLAASLVGAGVWTAMKFYARRLTVKRLKKAGVALPTRYKGVAENTSIVFNGRHPLRIVSQWRDPATHQLYVFYSKNLWFDPSEFVEQDLITVFVDPKDPGNYYMDTSFLPKVMK
jgi:hypothetical protein